MTSMRPWKRRLSFRGLSIQQRLPLLICVLLLCLMITFSIISYLGVKRSALLGGTERIQSLSEQLSVMFGQSVQNLNTTLRSNAIQEPVKKHLLSPAPGTDTAAHSALQRLNRDSLAVFVELMDRDKKSVIRISKDSVEKYPNYPTVISDAMKNETTLVGKMYLFGNNLYYPMIAAVTDQNKKIGYIINWRMISSSQRAVSQFSKLVGTEANFYIGNKDRSAWTNMFKAIPDPLPDDTTHTGTALRYSRNGEKMIGASKQIANTPWLVLVEFPQKEVLYAANRFLKWVIIIGFALLLVGIIIAWLMSRNITKPLKELSGAVTAIASGKFQSSVPVHRRDELGKLARAFNAMSVKVNRAKEELEHKVIEAGQMTEHLRELSAHLQNIREEERMHIAREMHDELGQLLTGFKMDVSWLHKRLGDSADPSLREKLEEMMGIVNDAAKFVRKLASELRPSILDDLGLVPALDWHSQEFRRRTNIEVEFRTSINELRTTEEIATGLFRMYQESLTNVARHAEATKVVSRLDIQNDIAILTITDDGKGFETNGSGDRKTLGLLGMKERAAMIGGQLEISSRPGKGTSIMITVPLRSEPVKDVIFN